MVVRPCYGILFSNKNKQSNDTHNDLNELLENCAEWIKSIPKGCIMHDFIYITTFLKW